jgi:hypothetical protein
MYIHIKVKKGKFIILRNEALTIVFIYIKWVLKKNGTCNLILSVNYSDGVLMVAAFWIDQ